MTPRTLLPLLALVTLAARPAVSQAPAPLVLADSIRGEIERAWLAGDRPRLEAAQRLADRATVLYPKEALLHHYAGYAVYRQLQLPTGTISAETKSALITHGLESLAAANRLTPMAESYAIRRALMAQTITDAASAMAVAAGLQEELAQAMRIGKENPRVWLVNGAGAFFTPAMWGGGAEVALGHLTKARNFFETDHPAKGMPAWGRAETSAWLGIVYQKLGSLAQARAAYQEALRLEPGFGWVKDVLLPGLDKGVQPFPNLP